MSFSREDIVAMARSWVGTPYHHQAAARGIGCDCLGLVRGLYREIAGDEPADIPPYSRDWAEARRRETLLEGAARYLAPVTGLDEAASGDVLVFRLRGSAMAKHAGILTSENTMVHAQEKTGCVEIHLSSWWCRRIAAVYRFPGIV